MKMRYQINANSNEALFTNMESSFNSLYDNMSKMMNNEEVDLSWILQHKTYNIEIFKQENYDFKIPFFYFMYNIDILQS